MRSVTVVGGSLAGFSAARALRAQGFDGRLTILGEEPHRPYDRPPLSKAFLAGRVEPDALSLAVPGDEGLDIDWRLGERAVALEPGLRGAEHVIRVASGDDLASDGVVIATGARARALTGSAPAGVHLLRTLDDAIALRAALRPGARLLIVGAGFIGAEIASTASGLGLEVTVVEAADAPLSLPLGPRMAAVVAGWHAEHGVRLLTGVGVRALLGRDRLSHVQLADGRELAADVVVVGIGSAPNTEWLTTSGLAGAGPEGSLAGGIRTDAAGGTTLERVVATGDVAAGPDPFTGHPVRREHWTEALQHPALAVSTLLGTPPPNLPPAAGLPYFWSDQYGVQLQFAGHALPGDAVEVVQGEPAERRFVAVYTRAGRRVAVLGVGLPRDFNKIRREIAKSLVEPAQSG